jgi:6,7-dimethyl-8-ribityllumazine synthase
MLKDVSKSRVKKQGGRYFIVASRYNRRYVDSMLKAAQKVLAEAGAESVEVIRVPGAFEIPVVAARIARLHQAAASGIICLGVILRGATTHAQHIGEAVTEALVQVQLEREVPVIHEVLLLENKQQAEERCIDPERNRGREAAQTAVAMARVMGGLKS